jgi:predicted metalloprotease with PDZ domain
MRQLVFCGLLACCFLALGSAFAQDSKAPTAEDALKKRLEAHEGKLADLRAAMLKECDDALAKVDETLKKAEKDLSEAKGEARGKAFEAVAKARGERIHLAQLRSSIERRIQLDEEHRPVPPLTEEQRLGLHTAPVSAVVVAQLALKKDEGIVVDRVDDNSPAAKAGLKAHDVLVQLAGKPVPANGAAFRKLLAELKPDEAVEVVVVRAGKPEPLKGLTLPAAKTPPVKPEGNK